MPLWSPHNPDLDEIDDGGVTNDTIIRRKKVPDGEKPYPSPYDRGERPIPGRRPRYEPPPMQCTNSGWSY